MFRAQFGDLRNQRFRKNFRSNCTKKPHPKNERGKSENGQRNRSESGERLFLLFFVGFGLLGAGFGLRFLVTLRGRAAAATATIFVVLVHHCYLNFIITHSRNSTPKIAATQQSNGPADINPLHKICQDVWSKCRKSWHTLIYLGKIYITLSDIIDPNAIPNSEGSVLTPEKDSY